LAQDVRNAYPNKPIVVVSFGSPFLKGFLPKDIGYVCAFGFRRYSENASAEVLLGTRQAEGLLPVILDETL
jgi:hypothetical protein